MNKWDKIWRRREKIYIPSLKYKLIRIYSRLTFQSFYKKIHVLGFENVSHTDPVIFAPNHQNALMDALAIVYYCGNLQPVFLARQDVFSSYLAARMLTILKIIPVYRDRDGGAEAIRKNESIFDIVHNTLINRKQIGIMPEASHGDKRRLKNTTKGTYRIAFRAQEVFDEKPAVKIIPVGLEYTDHIKYQAKLFINYGQPIEVSDYISLYKENPSKAILQLKRRYEDEVKKLMIHIPNEEYYETYENLMIIYGQRMCKKIEVNHKHLPDKVKADKQMIDILDNLQSNEPSILQELHKDVSEYFILLKKNRFRNWVIAKGKFSFLSLFLQCILLVLFSPLFLYGFINNYLPFKIPVWTVKDIKDLQFHSSVKFVVTLLTFPAFYLLQFLVVVLCSRGIWWIEVAYLISLPITGWIAKTYYFQFKKVFARLRFSVLKTNKKSDIASLLQLHKTIVGKMDKIVDMK